MVVPGKSRYIIDSDVKPLRGGQGIIYEAIDAQFERRVLLKRPIEGLSGLPDGRDRFEREAQVTARLQHPGIAPIYEYFVDEDGTPWCAMELVCEEAADGPIRAKSLDSLYLELPPWKLRRDDAIARRLLGILIQVANTISYAHRRGYIHRDLKCHNTLVTKERVVVIDWGNVRIMDHADFSPAESPDHESECDYNRQMTYPGDVRGTIPYSSPEQRADASTVDERSDVYSLGVMLFRMLQHGAAFTDKDVFVSADALDRRRIPRDLVEICRKAIELQPDARYASIADMRRDLENWLSDSRVSVRYSLTDAFWRTVRRHRSAASVLLVTVIAAFVYVGYQYDSNRRRAEELSQANGELDQAVTSNRQLADQAQKQLALISERQFSSTLREASTLLQQHDPAGALNLLDNEQLCPPSDREFAWNLLRERIATVRHLADIDAPGRWIRANPWLI